MRKFGDLLSYPLRSGVTVATSQRGVGIKMLNMGELFRYPRIPSVDMTRVEIDHSDEDRNLLQPGDLMFARRSLTLEGAGKCSIVQAVDEPTTWESSIIRARIDSNIAQPEFYFYYFSSPQGRRQIETIVEQVAAAGIRLSELRELEVPYPTLATQQAIAEILGALDDKIAANEKTAGVSRELARSVFARATTGGNKLAIRNVAKLVTRGIAPKYVESDGVAVLNQKCVRDQRINLAPSRMTQESSIRTEKLLRRDDVLVNSTGAGTLGRIARWTQKVRATVDSHITIVRFDPNLVEPVCAGFGLLQIEKEVEGLAEGSTGQTELRRDLLAGLEIDVPDKAQQVAVGAELSALDELTLGLQQESDKLAATRDELLPLLMSGTIRVREAEKVMEGVV
jgi:type I restriction enzyme S subunit